MSEIKPYPWQVERWESFAHSISSGRLPHALLFSGPRGVGKRNLAQVLSAALLCDAPNRDGTACGHCRSCGLLAAGTHPDYVHVIPEEGKRSIGIEAIRDLGAFLSLKSHYGTRKVVIITPAEAMTGNAANALLKTLEEPTEGSYLILCSDQPAALLATIRSRCQKFMFPPVSSEVATPWLQEQLDEERRTSAELFYRLSGGVPLRAVELAGEEESGVRTAVFSAMATLAEGSADPVAIAARWHELGAPLCLEWLYSGLQDLARVMVAGSDAVRNPDQRRVLESLAERMDLVSLHLYLEKIQQALVLSKGQVNHQLLLEELLVGWPRTANLQSRMQGVIH